MTRKPTRVREPVQAYLDRPDFDLLEAVARRTSLSKAEVIRQAIRRFAQSLDLAERPGVGLAALTSALDAAGDVPPDLAARHDEYLYAADEARPAQPAPPRRR